MALTLVAVTLMLLASASAKHKVNPHDVDILVRHVRTTQAKIELYAIDLEAIADPALDLLERLRELEQNILGDMPDNRDQTDELETEKINYAVNGENCAKGLATVKSLTYAADEQSKMVAAQSADFDALFDRHDRLVARYEAIWATANSTDEKQTDAISNHASAFDVTAESLDLQISDLDHLVEQQICHTILVDVNVTTEDSGFVECDVEDVFETSEGLNIMPTVFCSFAGIRSFLNEPEYEVDHGQHYPSDIEWSGFSLTCYPNADGTITVNLLDQSKSSLDEDEVTDVHVMIKACSFPPLD